MQRTPQNWLSLIQQKVDAEELQAKVASIVLWDFASRARAGRWDCIKQLCDKCITHCRMNIFPSSYRIRLALIRIGYTERAALRRSVYPKPYVDPRIYKDGKRYSRAEFAGMLSGPDYNEHQGA